MEPSKTALSGTSFPKITKRYWLAIRPKFLTASLLPVFVGSAYGYEVGAELDSVALLLALLAVAAVHGAVNVLNDVYDELNGSDRANTDRIYPYTGGSRFIQNDVINLEQTRRWGFALLFTGMLFGALLWLHDGPIVLLFGLLGITLGVAYSVPPLQLASRGLGESAVGIGFGVLPVVGSVWLQTGFVDWGALLLSMPVSAWVANILLINEVPDARADGGAGKRTLAVRFGNRGAGILYAASNLFGVLALSGAALAGFLPAWIIILPALFLLLTLKNARDLFTLHADMTKLKPAIESTLMMHAVGCLWLTFWCWWG